MNLREECADLSTFKHPCCPYLHPTLISESCKAPKPSKGQICCSDKGLMHIDAQLLEGNNDTRPRGTEAHCRLQQICQKASMAAGRATLKIPSEIAPMYI